jgi:hypothetical protein
VKKVVMRPSAGVGEKEAGAPAPAAESATPESSTPKNNVPKPSETKE